MKQRIQKSIIEHIASIIFKISNWGGGDRNNENTYMATFRVNPIVLDLDKKNSIVYFIAIDAYAFYRSSYKNKFELKDCLSIKIKQLE